MKRPTTQDEIFKILTFGIDRKKMEKKLKLDVSADPELRMRTLPESFLKSQQGAEKKDESDEETTAGPEIMKGLDIVPKAKKKKVSKTAEAHKEQVAHLRKLNKIFIWGDDFPDPLIEFEDLAGCREELINSLHEFGIKEPTPVQMQTIPVMLQRRDVLTSAPTGSGKTIAFLLPVLINIMELKSKPTYTRECLHAIILEPTRELAQQVYMEFLKYSQNLPVTCALMKDEIPKNANIIVSTPNRLAFAVEKYAKKLSSKKLKWLIVDESDRLFDNTEGDERCFRNQLAKIFQACSGIYVRRAFFSATFSYEVEEWCKNNLVNVAMICVGERNSAAATVKQELVFAGSEYGKVVAIRSMFATGFKPPVLIFVQSKDRAQQLVTEISSFKPSISVALISSEKSDAERNDAIVKFREGKIWVLVCTELMSRGLDFVNVNLVINFDLPTSIISYIHRIGRTGRAGRSGHAVTYFTESDLDFVRPIATVISQAGYPVPEYTLKMRNPTRREKKKLMKHAPKRKRVTRLTNKRKPTKDSKKHSRKKKALKEEPQTTS